MLKLNKLLYLSTDRRVFWDEIAPTKEQRKTLTEAKNAIRDHLRLRIAQATVSILGLPVAVEPKFRTQGSWSYKTCIQPAHMPPQEMDWDFGVYLPIQVWADNGPPKTMALAYFKLVEKLLEDLCEERGWKLMTGKKTCIRVHVEDGAHIDVPLYAAPVVQFSRIQERALAKSMGNTVHDSVALEENISFGELPEQAWTDLDDIMMATRSGEWIKSDPERVARWWNDRVEEHTDQLRRVSCYAKGWRDYQWPDGGGPTSVALMIGIAQKFKPNLGRDDLAFEQAMRSFAEAVKSDIREVGIDAGEEDFNRLQGDARLDASLKAEACVTAFQRARLRGEDQKLLAIQDAQEHLGARVPKEEDLVDKDAAVEVVLAQQPRRVVAPVVLATSAG